MKGKICGCWCDSVELPNLCVLDDPDACMSDCGYVKRGIGRKQCGHWHPMKTLELAARLTGAE